MTEDDLGIVYLIDNAQQFWSELEDILQKPKHIPTLQQLDSTLKRFLDLAVSYHEQYLQSPLQLEHACNLLLDSELFAFHSERMTEILVSDVQTNTDPHSQFLTYNILLYRGRRRPEFLRSHKRWYPLIPLLMDHVLVEIDSDTEDSYLGTSSHPSSSHGAPGMLSVPIEAKLRLVGVRLLYEVCRLQKFSISDLRIFDDSFIEYLFELVEQTRHMQDETFNYTVIKLIVALNEQFMVAALTPQSGSDHPPPTDSESKNRILRVLMTRLGSSKTLGENMIFMLNRARKTPDDICMQLLVLKILYLLFTTKGTSEYFYTNDLRVLVDVFLRELVDLDDESESLRHTYLRVLHPLLTKTQLREVPYKRPQIVCALESLMSHSGIREINSTTRRLVERCLSGDWCVQLGRTSEVQRAGTPSNESVASSSSQSRSRLVATSMLASDQPKTLKTSKSVEFKSSSTALPPPKQPYSPLDNVLRTSNGSSFSLASAVPGPVDTAPKRKGSAPNAYAGSDSHRGLTPSPPFHVVQHDIAKPASTGSSVLLVPPSRSHMLDTQVTINDSPPKQRRSAPPPPKRRKPPAIPVVGHTNGGATINAIKSSSTAHKIVS